MSTPTMRDIVIVSGAISAGVHAALAPAHFHESALEGVGFVLAAALLGVSIAVLAFRPMSSAAPIGAALVFVGLLSSYELAVTTGLEAVDRLGLATKLVELVGLVLALDLTRRRNAKSLPVPAVALTVMVAVFSALVALAVSGGHHHA
jgi:hypothetical protein